MPELTPKLGIKKPLGNETVSRAAFNENWDIIDQKTVADKGGVPSVQAGLDASKPTAGMAGRIYIATDTKKIYRDTGSSWVVIGSGGDADTVDGYHAGNSSGQIPVSNGTVNTNLNADKLDGYDANTGTVANTIPVRNASGQLPGDVTGNAATATKLATSRTLSLTGDVTGSTSFDGSANASISATLANSGVTAGTYRQVTVDAKGRVTAGSNPTTLGGYGITDAVKNAGFTPSIQAGEDTSKPTAGTAGRLYIATDTNKIYRDTGSVWQLVGTINWNDIIGKPSSFTPSAHKSTHASGGSDALTPADIGAAAASDLAAHLADNVKHITSTDRDSWNTHASRTDNPHATTAAQVGAAPSSHVGSGGSAHAVATTATSGFMSYTDKIKLDGIDIGATTAKIINLVSGYITNTNSTSPSEIKGTHIIWHSDYAGSRNIYFVVEGYTQNGGTAYYKLKDETSGTDIVTISTTSIGMPVIISSSNISIPDGHEIKAYMWISSTSYYVNVQSVRIMIL